MGITFGLMIVLVLTAIFSGAHGLLSILFMVIISRFSIGRDSYSAHGVSSGASRLGGVAILFALISGIILNHYLNNTLSFKNISPYFNSIFLFSLLIGLIGLVEDCTQSLSSKTRLSLILFAVATSLIVMHELLPHKLIIFDQLEGVIKISIVYLFTVIMVTGYINAGNIADGANGLLSLAYLVYFFFAYSIDPSMLHSSMMISLIVFFIYNVSTGKIFLGDFGAYFLSALVAFSSLEIYKNHEVSVFLLATILIYPCFELSRSLVVRFFNKASLMSADNYHLHNYVHNYLLTSGLDIHKSNSLTGILIASTTSFLPIYLFINGVNHHNDIWFLLFVLEFLFLSVIYFSLTKIKLKKI